MGAEALEVVVLEVLTEAGASVARGVLEVATGDATMTLLVDDETVGAGTVVTGEVKAVTAAVEILAMDVAATGVETPAGVAVASVPMTAVTVGDTDVMSVADSN